MNLRTKTFAALLSGTVLTSIATAETIKLYTWREQEIPLWEYISENDLVGDVDIEVVWIQGENYDSKLRIDLGNNVPDMFQGRSGAAWLQPYIEAEAIKPLAIDSSAMAAAALNAATGYDGKVYGVPFAIQMESVVYNKAVFEENEISVPTTMAEMEDAMATLKAAGVTPMAFGAAAGWWLNQVVGEVMTAGLAGDDVASALISGDACFTDPEFVATLQTIQNWNEAGYLGATPLADDYGSMRTAVALGEAAMMIDGAWSTGPASPMYEINPDLEMGFFPIPGDDSGKVYAFGDGSYHVNIKSENQAAAHSVLAFTASQEFAELFVELVGELPAFGDEFAVEDPRLRDIVDLIAADSMSVTPFFSTELNASAPSYGELVAAGYQELIAGDIDAEALAAKIQDGLNSWGYTGADKCGG